MQQAQAGQANAGASNEAAGSNPDDVVDADFTKKDGGNNA